MRLLILLAVVGFTNVACSFIGCPNKVIPHVATIAAIHGTVESLSYLELRALADSGQLNAGCKYRVTDFRTRHTMLLTQDINTGPTEILIVTALSANSLQVTAYSELYPQDLIEYELVNSSSDTAFDRGRITFRRDTRKNISSFEDWRSVKYRRGLSPETGRYTEPVDYSRGYVDRYPFNNSPDPLFFKNIRIERSAGGLLPDIVIGTGKSTWTSDIHIGQGSTRITIGDNTDTIEIAQVNGNITIGDNCTHIRIGVCSDYVSIADRCSLLNVGSNSSQIAIRDSVANCNIGENVLGITVGNGSPLSEVYIGHGVNFDPAPIITAPGVIEKSMSTVSAKVDITGQTTLELAEFKYAGIINLASKNSSESLNQLHKTIGPNESDFPVELRPMAGLKVALTGIPYESISADGQIMIRGDVVLDGDKGDVFSLKRKKVGKFSVFVEVSRSVY